MVDPIYLNIFVKIYNFNIFSRKIQKADQVFFVVSLWMLLCQCWKCRNLNKMRESLGMALHIECAVTVHKVHVRAFFSDTARAHSEISRSRIIFLAQMIQQQSAFIQCIHGRPNISQYLFDNV